MKPYQARILLPFLAFSAAATAVEHTDAKLFDQQVIRFAPAVEARAGADSDYIQLVSRQGQSAVFEASLTELTLARVKMADGKTYNRVMLPDGGSPAEPGKPNLTGYQKLVRIPDGTQLSVEIESVDWSKVYNQMEVDPVQLPFPDVVEANGNRPDHNMPFVKDQSAYTQPADAEEPVVFISDVIRVRGKSYAVISYRPIDFDPIEKTVRFAGKVRFKLHFQQTDSSSDKRADPLGDSQNGSVIDLRSGEDKKTEAKPLSNNQELTPAQKADYLIITADRFREAIELLAAWKRKKGYKVHVELISEVGNSEQQIKTYLQNAYSQGTMTSYVLFVGDHEDINSYEIIGHPYHGANHRWHTDYEYALLDGDDKYADVAIGRFPADTVAQVTSMVNHTLAYEQNPVDTDRYQHVLLAGQYQDNDGNRVADRMFMEDLHRVADFLGGDYDFFSGQGDRYNKGYQIHTALQWDADLTQPLSYGGWNYGTARINPPASVPQVWKDQGNGDRHQIADAINQGVGFVMHRDHGYGDGSGWADPHYTAMQVNALANGNMTPFVFSLNCATGWFDGKDSFTESWMRNANGGAVGFTGAARVSYSGYNDLMHAAIMDSFWDDYDNNWSSDIYPVSWRPAMALNRAKERLFNHYSTGNDTAVLTSQFFSWFGDPELEMRTKRPSELTVTYPEQLAKGQDAEFDVVVRSGDTALANARVALVSTSGKQYVATSDENGIAHFAVNPDGKLSVTVTEHNAKAYQGEIATDGEAPVAKVAKDITAKSWQWVLLDGRESVIPEGSKVTYRWQQIAGPKVRIDYADSPYAYALTPGQTGELKFQLTVTDEQGASSSAVQTVLVRGLDDDNKAPLAKVKIGQYGTSQWAALDGTASSDPDGHIVSYQWRQVSGPEVKLAYADTRYAYALTPSQPGKLTFELTVTDDKGKSASSTAELNVSL